jgi:hypothetical protein
MLSQFQQRVTRSQPDSARERAWQRTLARIEPNQSQQSQKESTRHAIATLPPSGYLPSPNGRAAPRRWREFTPEIGRARTARRWSFAQLVAAVLLVGLGIGYIVFDPFGGPDRPSSIPAAVLSVATPGTAEATSVAIPWVTTPPGPSDPALCHAAPAEFARYQALQSTPFAVAPVPAPYTDQVGTPADQATIDSVTATIMEFGACVNAGKFLNNANLYTEAGFAEDYTYAGGDFLDFIASGTRPASLEEAYVVFSVADVLVLQDGRVGAIVTFGLDAIHGSDYLIFTKVGDRYLIDWWVDDFSESSIPQVATPAATPGT